jgi:hypothetical protein
VNDVSALRRRQKEEREAALWSSRLAQLQQAVTDSQPDIEAAVLQARNCLQLWDQVHCKVEKDLPDSTEGDTAGEEAKNRGRTVVDRDDLERTVGDQPESGQEIVIDSEKNEKVEDKESVDREEHEREVSGQETVVDGRVMVDKEDDDKSMVEQTEEDKAVVDSLVDQHSEISKRWLPLVKKWLETLTKAGRRTDHQMLR